MNEFYLPLIISLTPHNIRSYYDVNASLAAHDNVIRPLLSNSIETFVYGLTEESDLFLSNRDILIRDRGKYKLDKTKECIRGHELLWNATSWKRGSIVIIVKQDLDFIDIFKNSYRPSLLETPNSGNTLSATKKCKQEASNGNIGICFPASNGIEWITIYAEQTHRDKLLYLAEVHCLEVGL